jgi:hypothetical protein
MHLVFMGFVWLLIAAYSFYLLGKADSPRERAGRLLVGAAAMLIAAALMIPQGGTGATAGSILTLISAGLGAVFMVAGLVLAFPGRRRPSGGE